MKRGKSLKMVEKTKTTTLNDDDDDDDEDDDKLINYIMQVHNN
jgi:hypothetical protein